VTGRVRKSAALVLVVCLGAASWLISRAEGRLEDETVAAADALQAWARFASTGDIDLVLDSFAEDGPQLRQLRSEVESIEPGPPYTFELSNAAIVGEGIVRGTVTISRVGELEQVFRWDIELVRVDNRWKLWSVSTSP
jgi:hypothetical protein